VEKNTLLCLLGPNGAGKSTTINCLTGVIEATAGDGEQRAHPRHTPGHTHQLAHTDAQAHVAGARERRAPTLLASTRPLLHGASHTRTHVAGRQEVYTCLPRSITLILAFLACALTVCALCTLFFWFLVLFFPAHIYGESIRSPSAMAALRRKMGVCPQVSPSPAPPCLLS